MRSDPNQLPEWITWTRLISGMFIFCTTIFGCIWYILDLQYSSRYQGKIDILEKENNGFREIARINLPAMLENVSTISQHLDKNVKEIMISKEAVENYPKIKDENELLKSKIQLLQEEVSNSKQIIAKLTPHKMKFSILAGDSRYIEGSGEFLGVRGVAMGVSARITFQNSETEMSVGNYIEYTTENSSCKIALTSIDIDTYECYFSLICEDTK